MTEARWTGVYCSDLGPVGHTPPMTSSTGPLDVEITDGIATLTMLRPEAMNGLDRDLKEALLAAVTEIAADDSVRVLILTGSGRAFCAGQDLKELLRVRESGETDYIENTVAEHYNPIVTALATMSKPVIAAVNGVAAGAGASLALACDFRIVAASAGFNFAFAGVALSCDTGSSWTLPRLVGTARAIDLLYFPRTVGSAESLEIGLASRVVDDSALMAESRALATKLANGPTVAYGAIRRSVAFAASHDFAQALGFEGEMMALTSKTEDHPEAVAAFVEKRAPHFTGR
ncbi:MAG: enoyl-CoA hydratase-related protein [Marmoricola sp.]